MTRVVNLRTIVIDALLSGEEMCASTFAKSKGFKQESVSRVLRDVAHCLSKRPAPNEPGKRRIYVRVADREALTRIRNGKTLGTNQYSNGAQLGRPLLSFDGLLNAWGIAVKHLDIPARVHCMMPVEEGLLEGILK